MGSEFLRPDRFRRLPINRTGPKVQIAFRADFVFPAPMIPKEILEREFFMEKIFKLKENGTTVRTEIVACAWASPPPSA